jgi:ATP/maltotriose-dependent transcriptional regulator MalT
LFFIVTLTLLDQQCKVFSCIRSNWAVNTEVWKVLTKREKEILVLVADAKANGETVRELAERTYNAYGTICFHLRNAYEKLGVTNLSGAIRRAEGAGQFQRDDRGT